MFYEKSFFKSIRKINRKTLALQYFLNKFGRLKQQVFSCEFCGIFKSSFYAEHLRGNTSKNNETIISS